MSKALRGPDLRDDKGIYSYDGRKYPGVTRCLSPFGSWEYVWKDAVDKDAKRCADALDNGEYMTGWREIDPGVWRQVDVTPVDYLRHDLSYSGARQMKVYKDRGTVLHSLLEGYAQGERVERADAGEWLEERIYGARMACSVDDCLLPAKGIIRWLDHYAPDIIASEVPVFSDTHEYAGTLDGLASIADIAPLCILDLKPSFKREHMAQLGAYANADFYLVAGDGPPIPYPLPSDIPGMILQYESGSEKIGHRMVESAMLKRYFEQMFLPALACYKEFTGERGPLPKNKAVWLKESK